MATDAVIQGWTMARRAAPRARPDRRRILIYGMNYAPELAGVGRYTGEIGAHLAAQGHEVVVVTTPAHYPGWRAREGHANRFSRERLAGADVHRCPLYLHEQMRGVRRLLAPLSFALTSAPVLAWRILAGRPHVVLCVEPTLFAAPAALALARLVGARTALHVQDLEVDAAFAVGHLKQQGLLPRLAAAFERRAMRGFDRVVTISHKMAEKIAAKAVDPARIAVVRNWVDLEAIRPHRAPSPYRAELGLPESAFVVLYSGNLGAKQGVGLLVEAARRLAHDPRVVFVVAGDGPMRGELEAAAAELANLTLLPFQPEARFGEFLGLADLHVLPQEKDAADLLLPSKLGGMLASGRRVVVTADPGTELADFLGASCRLVPPGEPEALAAAIAEIAAEAACPEAERQRLERAQSLSKAEGLARFARLILHPAQPEAESEPAAGAEPLAA